MYSLRKCDESSHVGMLPVGVHHGQEATWFVPSDQLVQGGLGEGLQVLQCLKDGLKERRAVGLLQEVWAVEGIALMLIHYGVCN